jgi:hypothetical protein
LPEATLSPLRWLVVLCAAVACVPARHRFTTDLSTVAQMVHQGWIADGPAMCVRRASAG